MTNYRILNKTKLMRRPKAYHSKTKCVTRRKKTEHVVILQRAVENIVALQIHPPENAN